MPTYQYSCTECGHSLEVVQSFSDDSLTVCPECQGRLRKVFNAVGVVFKGSGFYRNDSRAGSSSSDSASGKEGSSKDSGSGSSGSSGKDSGGSTTAAKDSGSTPAKGSSSGSGSASPPKSA